MYADVVTRSMKLAIDETNRRRQIQERYNKVNNITPKSVAKTIDERISQGEKSQKPKIDLKKIPKDEYAQLIRELTGQMDIASANLEFEKAADLRDLISEIKAKL